MDQILNQQKTIIGGNILLQSIWIDFNRLIIRLKKAICDSI